MPIYPLLVIAGSAIVTGHAAIEARKASPSSPLVVRGSVKVSTLFASACAAYLVSLVFLAISNIPLAAAVGLLGLMLSVGGNVASSAKEGNHG